MTTPDPLPAGPWQCLLGHALTLIDEIAEHGGSDPFWTFGGGTVLMLRYSHRLSKGVDIVPDPQYLGFVNPRISDVALDITTEYEEHAQFVKLLLREGEIDFVVSPNLTDPGYDQWTLLDRAVKAETAAEIVVKKMWHRGDRVTARDLFDLSLVIKRDPAALLAATLVGVKAPSARPMTARINKRPAKLSATPEKLESSEKVSIAPTRTRLRPMWSDRRPMRIEHAPHASPRMPMRLPSS